MTTYPVLFVDHAEAIGGAEVVLLLLLERLDRGRFVPHLATCPGDLAATARKLQVTVHEIPLVRLRRTVTAPVRLARGVRALATVIRRERIRLVCSESARASAYAAVAARLTGRRHVWHVHDVPPPRAYAHVMCALSAVAISVSAAVGRKVPCDHKRRVIHNGIHTATFAVARPDAAARLRASWGVPSYAILIGKVARLQPWKGQHDVIVAAERLLQRLPDVFFAIIGGDIFGDAAAYEAALRASVARRGLAERVIFTGHQADMPAVLSALDIVVHAGLDDPLPTILLEASAAGLPIAAYDSGGVPEIVINERTALLVPPGDTRALADALARLATDRQLAGAFGAAARARACERFDVQRWVPEMQDALLQAIAGAGAHTSRVE
jgi:glycosyltransferase involved in cell wall biosynthesis